MIFLRALAVLLGTIIGAGIFGLPYAAQKAGFFVALSYFLLMTAIITLIHLLFAEVVWGTPKIHRLPGYVAEYLGEKWKKITFFVLIISFMGALLVYLIVGGNFLNYFFSPLLGFSSPELFTLLFFIFGSFFIFRGIKAVSQVELILTFVLLLIFAISFVKIFPSVDFNNFKNFNPEFIFLPYGVIIFSLWGAAVIPEIKEMLVSASGETEKSRKNLKKIISLGIILSAVIYIFFIFMVLGSSGKNTSKEALSGLAGVLGANSFVLRLGFIFAVVACFTSFLTIGLTLKKILWYDFKVPKNISWFITCFVPLFLFLLGFKNFIKIIGLLGAISLGIEGIIIIFLYYKFLKRKNAKKINPFYYFLISIFCIGIVLEIFYFIFDSY